MNEGDWVNSNVYYYLSLTTAVSGRIQDGGTKLFGNVEGRKLHGAKITLYTVMLIMKHFVVDCWSMIQCSITETNVLNDRDQCNRARMVASLCSIPLYIFQTIREPRALVQ